MSHSEKSMKIAIAWCLAWGKERQPQFDLEILQQMREAMQKGKEVPEEVRSLIKQVQQLESLEFPNTLEELKQLTEDYPTLWNSEIGLVYGGATKIKQYVFEAAKLPDIRGASALLDQINLVDLPGFFQIYKKEQKSVTIEQWLNNNFPELRTALIPELVIYSTGGNILAFCPAAFVNDLANAIEQRYTEETQTANSCAVGQIFKPLEIRLGLLSDPIEKTFWLEQYCEKQNEDLVIAYYGQPDSKPENSFIKRKNFNELVTKLAILFNQRRSGNETLNRPSRRYPPMFETHPYLKRDETERRLAITQVSDIPSEPYLSEALVRKRIMGQITKREVSPNNLPDWFKNLNLEWQPNTISVDSWVAKFETELKKPENHQLKNQYYKNHPEPKEARTLRELGNVYNRFVAYIYADGNNMGGYIQNEIKTPQDYQKFSKDIFEATEKAVYIALAEHLEPHQLKNLTDPDHVNRNGEWIHPFEIITIGGDDVMLIVPANKALAIAKTIGEEFEKELLNRGYSSQKSYESKLIHRYQNQTLDYSMGQRQCELSMSTGVLITDEKTPIYYAEGLTNQLLKSAKKRAKLLKTRGYSGGTIDFLTMKSVTMIASTIESFREEGLSKEIGTQKLKFYAAPYTLHEIGGLLESVKALKEANFPRSQLYQIRSLLERGKQTAILNYRYFRVRLKPEDQKILKDKFEETWCKAKTNNGNLVPWMYDDGTYETIWRDLVDLYPFIEQPETETESQNLTQAEAES